MVCLRGHLRELFFDGEGWLTDSIDVMPNGPVMTLNIPLGQWHTVEVVKSGTVILEYKDGAYESLAPDDIMEIQPNNTI